MGAIYFAILQRHRAARLRRLLASWCACRGRAARLHRRVDLGAHADAGRGRGGGAGPHVVTAVDVVVVGAGCAGLSRRRDAGRGRRPRGRRRGAPGARRTHVRDARPDHRRVGRQRPARAARLLPRHAGVRSPHRRRSAARGAERAARADGRRRRASASELRCPALPSPLHLVAGVLGVDGALAGATGSRCSGWRRALSAGAAAAAGQTVRAVAASRTARRPGCASCCGSRWRWPRSTSASTPRRPTTFAEVVRRMLGPGPDDAALVLPARSLTHTFVEPGGGVHRATWRPVRGRRHRARGVRWRPRHRRATSRASAIEAARGDRRRCPGTRSARSVRRGCRQTRCVDGGRHARRRCAASPIVTANLWFDRPVLDAPFVGLPGRVVPVGVRQRPGHPWRVAPHLSLVCSGADDVVEPRRTRPSSRPRSRELRPAPCPPRAAARLVRGTAVRERRATFSLAAGEPARPATHTAVPGLLAGRRLDRHRPAGHHRERRRQRPPRRPRRPGTRSCIA